MINELPSVEQSYATELVRKGIHLCSLAIPLAYYWISREQALSILIPLAPSAAWSAAGISLSILAVSAFSVNLYTMPLDVYEGALAAFDGQADRPDVIVVFDAEDARECPPHLAYVKEGPRNEPSRHPFANRFHIRGGAFRHISVLGRNARPRRRKIVPMRQLHASNRYRIKNPSHFAPPNSLKFP